MIACVFMRYLMYVCRKQLLRQLLQPGLGSKEAAAPRGLRRKLLAHTVALIEMDYFVFSSSDIFVFMQALFPRVKGVCLTTGLSVPRFVPHAKTVCMQTVCMRGICYRRCIPTTKC